MKAVVFHDVGDIRLETVKDPKIKAPTDAIVEIVASAICGTDLHMVRGTMTGMKPGTILGHEAIGIVAEVGKEVRNFTVGDRVVVASTIACGYCSYCRCGYYAQCDTANPNGKEAGTAFFGGPAISGAFHGLQAERARIPYANVGLVKLPEDVDDSRAILISDIFPTGYFGAEMAEIKPGNTVAVFGCGPVGQFAIASAKQFRAGRIFAVDTVHTRLDMARAQGAETIDFNDVDPVEAIRELTGGIGVDRAIDAVGVDAIAPNAGPAAKTIKPMRKAFKEELNDVAPKADVEEGAWGAGDAPSLVLYWAVQALAKAGTLSIIGVYPPTLRSFPIGEAMNKNLKINMGNCHHRKYIPLLIDLVRSHAVDPAKILTQTEPLVDAVEAYRTFSRREPGWVKVRLTPGRQ